MWSFSRSMPSEDDSFNLQNIVNPDLATGQSLIPPHVTPLEGRINLRKFSGYPTQDPERFLSDFGAYCVFNRITEVDNRKVAAFQLHLDGPAQIWFRCLDDDDKSSWDAVYDAFQQKYSSENNKPVLLVETEQFQNLKLLPSQEIEEYFSRVLEKGRKLSKSTQEVLLKFIQGLPPQLAFFVRAGNPDDIHAALTSAKMGEAYGYRFTGDVTKSTSGSAAAVRTQETDRLHYLEKSVTDLSHKLDKLVLSNTDENKTTLTGNKSTHMPQRTQNTCVCFSCSAPGHIRRRCNLASGSADPNATCQLCLQCGHMAMQCKLFISKQSSGNFHNPRNTRRGPLGERH